MSSFASEPIQQKRSATNEGWLNSDIAEAREHAMHALAPSESQVERGLALHEHAIVIDTYGFSAFAASDPEWIADAAKQNLDTSSIAQISLDSTMSRMAEDAHQRMLFEEAWKAAGVTCIFRNSGEEGNDIERLLLRLAHNTYVTDQLSESMRRITTANDIENAKADGRFGFCMTTNGVPIPTRWRDEVEGASYIRVFRQLGVRMMHVTYNRRNLIGDGCGETKDAGLSDFGRAVVREMCRQGVIVDLAHSSEKTAIDAAKVADLPIVISHATCRTLNEHCRAKNDDVLRAVADTGGLMGICGIPTFLGGTGDINALLDHVDHVVKTVGIDHVAIGTDVATRLPNSPQDEEIDLKLPPRGRSFESHWPEGDLPGEQSWTTPTMAKTLAWTNWPLFTVGLTMRGYSDDEIQKIIGGNMLRLLRTYDDK